MLETTREMFSGFAEELTTHQDRRERIIKCSRDITALSKEIMSLFERIGQELDQDKRYIYKGNYTGGLQEWIECITFLYFLHYPREFATIDIIRQRLEQTNVHCSEQDYLLGLSDLTGEIMRYGISSVGTAGVADSEDIVNTSGVWVRQTRNALAPISPSVKGLGKKMTEMRNSLQKLERVAYTLSLKKEEYADYPEALKDAVRRLGNEPNNNNDEED